MRSIAIPFLIVALPASNPDRTLEEFAAWSRKNLARCSVAELSGYDPVRDREFHLWTQRAAASSLREPGTGVAFLHGIDGLSVAEAERLAAWRGSVFLPDLATLDEVRARALVGGVVRELHLDGLRTLEPPVARLLAGWNGDRLSLGGLAELAPQEAAVLATFRGALALDGLAELDVATAAALATWEGYGEKVFLSFDGLAYVSAPVLERLAACRGWGLSLGGLRSLQPEQAERLADLPCAFLRLDGVTELPLETARVLARWRRKFLSLDGLTRIDDEVEALVRRGCEAVSLDALEPPFRARRHLAPLPGTRYEALAFGHEFRVFVVGGRRAGRSVAGDVRALDVYDVTQNEWSRGAPLPVDRSFAAGALLDGCFYVCGGEGGERGAVHRYRIDADRWERVADQPAPRTHAAAVAARGRLWVLGGWDRHRGSNLASVEIYDPAQDVWSRGPDLPTAVHGHAAAVLEGTIHVFGGDADPRRHLVLEDGAWVERARTPSDAWFAQAVALGGSVWLIGGAPTFRALHAYDSGADRWRRAPEAPTARHHFAATAVDGALYVLGGLPVEDGVEDGPRALDRFDPRRDAWFE